LSIDLLPGLDVFDWLREARQQQGKQLLKTLLTQRLGRALVAELLQLWWPDAPARPLADYSDKQLQTVADRLQGWTLKPSATEGYRTAEVTLGGVATEAISSKTMEARDCPGLYFIGEVLDVSGHLGGFNFQWAWSSGYSAGLAVRTACRRATGPQVSAALPPRRPDSGTTADGGCRNCRRFAHRRAHPQSTRPD